MKILVVDDEDLLVKGIRFNLQNDGYEVISGSNGLEAVASTILPTSRTTLPSGMLCLPRSK